LPEIYFSSYYCFCSVRPGRMEASLSIQSRESDKNISFVEMGKQQYTILFIHQVETKSKQ